MPAHDPAWPDKIMAAALLVTIGGVLGAGFVALRVAGATIEVHNAPLLQEWPVAIMLPACILAIALGIFAYIHQSWLLVVLGILADVASLGFLGVSSLIALVAIWPLVRSFAEGEETRLDRQRMRSYQWPDKAIMASTLLASGAVVTLVSGLLILTDRIEAPVGSVWGAASVFVAAVALVAARQLFHLRRAWLSWVAAGLVAASAAFYVAGPVLAVAVFAYLWMAERELEFVDEHAIARAA